jgi:formate dehydrogenase major subunit
MAITRRDFLKYTAVTGAALYLGIFDLKPIEAYAQLEPPLWTSEALSVGVYCSGGCGMIVGKGTLPGYNSDYITYVQGNPDSIINHGRICSKCASSAQISTIIDNDPLSATYRERIPNPNRITQPMYRAAGASDWTPISWTDAISQIATRTATARAAGWQDTDPVTGVTCNRTTGIAAFGGSSLNNEAAYMMSKLYRALGLVYTETQARN